MKPAQAGKLRKRFEVQENQSSPAKGADRLPAGELVPRWVTVWWSYGSVEPLSGREFWNAAQVQADVTHKVTLRFRPGRTFTADMRLKMGDRIFHLSEAPRDIEERHRLWEVLAVEQTANPV